MQVKTDELNGMRGQKLREIDQAKQNTYLEAEKKFLERMEAREYNYKQETAMFEQKIRKEYAKDDVKNAKHQFYWAFDKWRMLTMI